MRYTQISQQHVPPRVNCVRCMRVACRILPPNPKAPYPFYAVAQIFQPQSQPHSHFSSLPTIFVVFVLHRDSQRRHGDSQREILLSSLCHRAIPKFTTGIPRPYHVHTTLVCYAVFRSIGFGCLPDNACLTRLFIAAKGISHNECGVLYQRYATTVPRSCHVGLLCCCFEIHRIRMPTRQCMPDSFIYSSQRDIAQ